MFKLLISVGILTFGLRHANATASCHELHQSQLISLNERMNQMIDTISTLLPKPLKKPKPPATPALAPVPSAPVYDTSYYAASPTYAAPPPPTPQIMYVTPTYAPMPTAVFAPPPAVPKSISTPQYYYPPTETGLHSDFKVPAVPPSSQQYQNLPLPHYTSPAPITPAPITPPPQPSYLPLPYPFIQQYSADYSHLAPGYPLPVPSGILPYQPGFSHYLLPGYPMHSEVPPQYA